APRWRPLERAHRAAARTRAAGRRRIHTCQARRERTRRRGPSRRATRLTSTDYASVSEAIVEAAVVAAEEGGQEPEAGGDGEDEPHQGGHEGAPEIERRRVVGRDDANAGRHFAERLSAGGECDEIAAVLHQQKRHERTFRHDAEVVE